MTPICWPCGPSTPKVFGYYHRTKAAVGEYRKLEDSRSEVQLNFAALYAVVSLVILMAAVWMGLWFANRLAGAGVQPDPRRRAGFRGRFESTRHRDT